MAGKGGGGDAGDGRDGGRRGRGRGTSDGGRQLGAERTQAKAGASRREKDTGEGGGCGGRDRALAKVGTRQQADLVGSRATLAVRRGEKRRAGAWSSEKGKFDPAARLRAGHRRGRRRWAPVPFCTSRLGAQRGSRPQRMRPSRAHPGSRPLGTKSRTDCVSDRSRVRRHPQRARRSRPALPLCPASGRRWHACRRFQCRVGEKGDNGIMLAQRGEGEKTARRRPPGRPRAPARAGERREGEEAGEGGRSSTSRAAARRNEAGGGAGGEGRREDGESETHEPASRASRTCREKRGPCTPC